MATIGAKEQQRRAMREGKSAKPPTKAPKTQKPEPTKVQAKPAEQAQPAPEKESVVRTKKQTKKAAPRAAVNGKTAAAKVDRSPLTVGNFIADAPLGVLMADLEREFKMDAHPMRSKIHAAKHKLGFTIEYDAQSKRYTGTAPKAKKKAA
jgi:hypothetical protein